MKRLLITTAIVTTALSVSASAGVAQAAPCYIGPDGGSYCPASTTSRVVEEYASDRPAYKGFATIRSNMWTGVACAANTPCPDLAVAAPVAAWDWTATGWKSTTITDGTRVYAWPFSGGWEWVYHYGRAKWLAVRADKVFIRSYTVSCIVNGINTCPQPL